MFLLCNKVYDFIILKVKADSRGRRRVLHRARHEPHHTADLLHQQVVRRARLPPAQRFQVLGDPGTRTGTF
jgi:hypothetical protein